MSYNQQPKALRDVIELVVDNRGKNPRSYAGEGIPVVDNYLIVSHGEVNLQEAKRFIDDETYKTFIRKHVKHNDVIVTLVGNGYGQVALIPNCPCVIIQNTIGLRCNDQNDNRYLYYLLRSNRNALMNLNRGAAQPSIKVGDLLDLEFKFPQLRVQESISEQLWTIDKKIQLNHQINQTLEQMAQAVFKSWFVDFEPVKAKIAAHEHWHALQAGNEPASPVCYVGELDGQPLDVDLDTYMNLAAMQAISGKDAEQLAQMQVEQPEEYAELCATAELFPSSMQDSELGEMPEGWCVVPISELGRVVCGKTPPKKRKEYYGEDVPFIKIPDMHGKAFVTNTSDALSVEGAASQPKKAVPAGSICVSCIATVGLVVIASEESHTNQQINSIVPESDNLNFYLYFRMNSLSDHLKDLASGGSATLNLNTSTFSKIEIIKPEESLLDKYRDVVLPLFKRVLSNSHEIKTLEKARDALLPKLLAGELTL